MISSMIHLVSSYSKFLVFVFLCGCVCTVPEQECLDTYTSSLPFTQEDYYDGYPEVTVRLEDPNQELTLFALDVSKILASVAESWFSVYGTPPLERPAVQACLDRALLYVPRGDEEFVEVCQAPTLGVGCMSRADRFGAQCEASYVIVVRWDYYQVIGSRNSFSQNYIWVLVHEATHRILDCMGNSDAAHQSPVWNEFEPVATQAVKDWFL